MWVTIPIWLALIWASYGYLELVYEPTGTGKDGGANTEVHCLDVGDTGEGARYYCYGV